MLFGITSRHHFEGLEKGFIIVAQLSENFKRILLRGNWIQLSTFPCGNGLKPQRVMTGKYCEGIRSETIRTERQVLCITYARCNTVMGCGPSPGFGHTRQILYS